MLLRFLHTLHHTGRAELETTEREALAYLQTIREPGRHLQDVEKIMAEWHAAAALDCPGKAPAFHTAAAIWGAILLFQAAVYTAFRSIEPEEIIQALENQTMPDAENPAAHFSADLCLRHWPDLYRMAQAQSQEDQLVTHMRELARQFSLSALGMNLADPPTPPILEHSGLRQLFAERALERSDHAALAHPVIHELIRAKLGAHASIFSRCLLTTLSPS